MFLRPAEADDAMAVARIPVRSRQAAYRKLFPDDYLDWLCSEIQAARYDFATLDSLKPRTILALEEGELLGFATTAPSREPDLPGYGNTPAPPDLAGKYAGQFVFGRGDTP